MQKETFFLVYAALLLTAGAVLSFALSRFIRAHLFRRKGFAENPARITLSKILLVFLFYLCFYLVPVLTGKGISPGIWDVSFLILLILAGIDILSHFLPAELQILLLLSSFFTPVKHLIWYDKLSGFLIPALVLLAIYWIIGQRQSAGSVGFGFSDAMFGGWIGLLIGWYQALLAIAVGLILSGIFSAILLSLRTERTKSIPLSPFFVIGIQIIKIMEFA